MIKREGLRSHLDKKTVALNAIQVVKNTKERFNQHIKQNSNTYRNLRHGSTSNMVSVMSNSHLNLFSDDKSTISTQQRLKPVMVHRGSREKLTSIKIANLQPEDSHLQHNSLT